MDDIDINFTCNSLMAWFLKSQRPLPWREKRSLYGTVVSEFMLQQTQVKTVVPYYGRWMERFPTIQSVVTASLEEVLSLWEGLGYYSRARHLHELCQELSSRETFPATPAEWQELKGIGPYTAAAIAAIGQNYNAIVVDGNVIRVICRLFAIGEVFADKSQAERRIRNYSDRFLIPEKCQIINEALMEFGAIICKPKSPSCHSCPLESQCATHRRQLAANEIPHFRKKIYGKVTTRRLFIIQKNHLLLHISQGNRLRNIAELPEIQQLPPLKLENQAPVFRGKRSIGLQNIQEEIFMVAIDEMPEILDEIAKDKTLRWIKIDQLNEITLSGPHRRWIGTLLQSIPKSENCG